MRQTLFHIPHELYGLPVLGFGWALIAWAGFSLALLAVLVRRQGWSRDTRGYAPVLLAIGAAIAYVLPVLEEKTPWGQSLGLPIRGYGVFLLAGVVSGVALALSLARRARLDVELVYSTCFWMFLAGIAGGRAFFVIQYWPEFRRPSWRETIVEVLKFTEGGLVVYGALLGSLAAYVAVVLIRRAPAWKLGDVLAPGMVLGLAIGRLGCLMNGCCYGDLCDSPTLGIRFPAKSPPYAHQQRRGQLHGFSLARNAAGRPVVARVDFDRVPLSQPDRPPTLAPGDVVQSLQLSPISAYYAARGVTALAGRPLVIRTADGRRITLTIGPPPNHFGPYRHNELGFDLRGGDGRQAVVAQAAPGGAAAAAGLRAGDVLVEIRLPATPDLDTAEAVMQYADTQLTVETATGKLVTWSLRELPARSLPVHPTQLYSAMNAALICLLLYAWWPFRRRDGEVLALMLTLYPLTRFLLEAVRTDEPGRLGTPLTISQLASVVAILVAAGFWVYLGRQPRTATAAASQT